MKKRLFALLLAVSANTCYYHIDFGQRALYACGDEWQGSNGQIACGLVYQAP
jgi:hypothetical protein